MGSKVENGTIITHSINSGNSEVTVNLNLTLTIKMESDGLKITSDLTEVPKQKEKMKTIMIDEDEEVRFIPEIKNEGIIKFGKIECPET